MTFIKLAFRSLCFYRGINLTIFLTVAIISTILTGALFIGDSMRKSLRETVLERLGKVDSLILSDHWLKNRSSHSASNDFISNRPDSNNSKNINLPNDLDNSNDSINSGNLSRFDNLNQSDVSLEHLASENLCSVYPGMMIKGSIRRDDSKESFNVVIYGVSDSFWQLNSENESDAPSKWNLNEIVINESLAQKMGTTESANFLTTIYLNGINIYPMESLFTSSDETSYRYKTSVRKILNNQIWPSNFSLFPDQRPPLNVFIPIERLQRLLKLDNQVNIYYSAKNIDSSDAFHSKSNHQYQNEVETFHLEDLGLYVEQFSTRQNQFIQLKNRHFLFSEDQEQFLVSQCQEIFSRQLNAAGLKISEIGKNAFIQPTLTHLVNSIQCEKTDDQKNEWETSTNDDLKRFASETPYSLITGLNIPDQTNLLTTVENISVSTIKDDEIYLNSWTADDLNAQKGDFILLRYYSPENSLDQPVEHSIRLRLAGILKMKGLTSQAQFVPEIEHLTDAQTLSDWDPPFPFDAKKIRPKDEEYWKNYRTTSKGFISLKTAQTIFGSRFGKTTSLLTILPSSPELSESIQNQLNAKTFNLKNAALFGISTIPVRENQLAASSGSTPFDVLFLCFSFFLILSVLVLLILFVRFSIDAQSRQTGILQTFGFSLKQITTIILLEYIPLTIAGALLGIFSARGFTQLMIYSLNHYWTSAIGIPFLKPHESVFSASIGFVITTLTVLLTIIGTVKTYKRFSQNDLLKSNRRREFSQNSSRSQTFQSSAIENSLNEMRSIDNHKQKPLKNFCFNLIRPVYLFWGLFILTFLFLGISLICQDQQIRMSFFFGTACLTLILLIWVIFLALHSYQKRQKNVMNLIGLFLSYLADHAFQTALSIGLLASSLFIIIAVGSFKLKSPSALSFPDKNQRSFQRNDGGFALVTETSLPFFMNGDDLESQSFFSNDDLKILEQYQTRFFQLRATSGENVGCSNLYQGTKPRILGVPESLRNCDHFLWADFDKNQLNENSTTPLQLLASSDISLQNDILKNDDSSNVSDNQSFSNKEPSVVGEVPIILDMNTALYSLHLYGGVGEIFPIELPSGKILNGKVVALLSNSIFQGEILMSEENLLHYFPQIEGYQILLTEIGNWNDSLTNPNARLEDRNSILKTISSVLNQSFVEHGTTTETTIERLNRFNSVQNTYIAIFQALGGLGILLGTFGLAVVRLRSFLERKYEFCLLRMFGFSRCKIVGLISLESLFIIFVSLFIALTTAIIALLPELTTIFSMNQFNDEFVTSITSKGQLLDQMSNAMLHFFHQFQNFNYVFYGILLIGLLSDWISMLFILRFNILRTMKNK